MKSQDERKKTIMKSLPVRGAWIEMACVAVCFSQAVSLPVRGAWIEMDFVIVMVSQVKWSLPVRGAWIEILSALYK